MARALRLQYSRALYHVISRGDWREDIYDDVYDSVIKQVFQKSLEATGDYIATQQACDQISEKAQTANVFVLLLQAKRAMYTQFRYSRQGQKVGLSTLPPINLETIDDSK